ncbi:hypothetical protein ACP70R_041671 [Stipagrostis hirtigluma subsp. patula]
MGDASSGAGAGEKQASGGLPRLVWFRQMLQRWQSSSNTAAAARRSNASGDDVGAADNDQAASAPETATSSAAADGDKDRKPRLPRIVAAADEKHQHAEGGNGSSPVSSSSPMTPEPPSDVPRGCCAVYVGAERRRFVIPTAYLDMAVFGRLLEKAEEEFGFDYRGAGIIIPCDTEAFKWILLVMDRHRQGLVDDARREPQGAARRVIGGSMTTQAHVGIIGVLTGSDRYQTRTEARVSASRL